MMGLDVRDMNGRGCDIERPDPNDPNPNGPCRRNVIPTQRADLV